MINTISGKNLYKFLNENIENFVKDEMILNTVNFDWSNFLPDETPVIGYSVVTNYTSVMKACEIDEHNKIFGMDISDLRRVFKLVKKYDTFVTYSTSATLSFAMAMTQIYNVYEKEIWNICVDQDGIYFPIVSLNGNNRIEYLVGVANNVYRCKRVKELHELLE